MEVEPGDVGKDGIRGEQRRADVNSGRCDPQVVGVDRLVERMSDLPAGVTQLRCGGQ